MAAHITAAAAGGPRFDPGLASKDRSDISNAIWLCQNCAKLIDNDPLKYNKGIILEWKRAAEQAASSSVGSLVALGVDDFVVEVPINLEGLCDLSKSDFKDFVVKVVVAVKEKKNVKIVCFHKDLDEWRSAFSNQNFDPIVAAEFFENRRKLS